MSAHLYASWSNEIPWDVIKKHCPEQIKVLEEAEENDSENLKAYAEDDLSEEDPSYEVFSNAVSQIYSHFKEKFGLDLCFYYRANVDEESIGDLSMYYFDVENAVTVNPSFSELLAGASPITSWVTF